VQDTRQLLRSTYDQFLSVGHDWVTSYGALLVTAGYANSNLIDMVMHMLCVCGMQGVALRCAPCGALLLNAQAYRTHMQSKVRCSSSMVARVQQRRLHPSRLHGL
jgi:hypothetical protein